MTGMGYSLCPQLPADDKRLDKFAAQRAERGFDDTETWSLSSTLAAFALPRLKRFREIAMSHPAGMDEHQWDSELEEMIWAMQQIVDDDSWSFDDPDRVQAALKLFGERFMDLWW